MSTLRVTAFLIFVLVTMLAIYAFLLIYVSRLTCIVLPNGYTIGHDAVFSDSVFLTETMTLRYPNGKILAAKIKRVHFFIDPENPRGVIMLYDGGELSMPGMEIMSALWDDAAFGGKWYEHGEKYKQSEHIISYPLYRLFEKLAGHPGIDSKFCGTPWFDWDN